MHLSMSKPACGLEPVEPHLPHAGTSFAASLINDAKASTSPLVVNKPLMPCVMTCLFPSVDVPSTGTACEFAS